MGLKKRKHLIGNNDFFFLIAAVSSNQLRYISDYYFHYRFQKDPPNFLQPSMNAQSVKLVIQVSLEGPPSLASHLEEHIVLLKQKWQPW